MCTNTVVLRSYPRLPLLDTGHCLVCRIMLVGRSRARYLEQVEAGAVAVSDMPSPPPQLQPATTVVTT